MERKSAADFPQELLDLFDRYVHGDIGRREFLDGAKKFATGGVTATALWESLRPNYAWAQQVAKDDSRIRTGYVTAASGVTWCVPRTPAGSCPACSWCTKTAG